MTTNLFGPTVEDVLGELFEEGPAELFVVNPSDDELEQLVDAATAFEGDLPEIRVLAEERTLKDVMSDFIVASNAADLVDAESLTFRSAEDVSHNTVLVTEDRVVALVAAGDRAGGLVGDDADFVAATRDAYLAEWESAEPFHLRTPPITRVRETLETEIGADSLSDFDAVLASMETARGNGDGLDEVTISLLVAAKNNVLLYDISKWGEDVGIASKATFSRTKTRLEDMGLIDTEKVPIDVGRPRLRLKLADERLEDADAPGVASVAQSVLAS